MFVEILIAITCLFFQPTINHFIGDFDECTASKVCNHTWTAVCGNFEAESSHRLFLDDCDLHEYNCENNTTYVEVDNKVCEAQCTQSTSTTSTTTTTTSAPAKVSTIKSSEGTKTETTKVTSTKKVIETNKDKTDTSTNFVAPTPLTMTTGETKTTRQTSEITTQASATTQPTEKPVINNVDTPTDITTDNGKFDENTIPDDTSEVPTKTTSTTTTTTNVTTTTSDKPGCLHCSFPSSWATTAVGETRDFVQMLKERFGDRVKILRDTTHYPKNPTYARKRLAFIPGYHMEGRKRRFY